MCNYFTIKKQLPRVVKYFWMPANYCIYSTKSWTTKISFFPISIYNFFKNDCTLHGKVQSLIKNLMIEIVITNVKVIISTVFNFSVIILHLTKCTFQHFYFKGGKSSMVSFLQYISVSNTFFVNWEIIRKVSPLPALDSLPIAEWPPLALGYLNH